MKFLKVIFSLAVALSLVGGIDAVSIKEARAAGKLKVKNNMVTYDGSIRLTWKLDSWEGIKELAQDYPDLEVLSLSHNKLTSIPPEIGQLKNLQDLYLSGNKLTSIPPEIGQLKNLKYLSLMGNRLNNAQALGTLAKMKWLKRLNVAYNRLSLKQGRWIKKQLPHTKVKAHFR